MTAAAAPRTATLSPSGLRRVLVTLCATEITSYGVLTYAFAVLAPTISAETGWSTASVVGAFSAGQVVAAVVGIPVGRRLDRHGPRGLMTTGSLGAVLALVVLALAPGFTWFVAGWLLAGTAMGAVLYPPAFAALTRWYGPRRVSALTTLTLVAGFASTVFAPLTAALVGRIGWRGTYLVLAAVLALITVPGHLWGLRGAWPVPDDAPAAAGVHAPAATDATGISRSGAFAVLVGAFTLGAVAVHAVVINLVPLLGERGVGTDLAAWVLGLGGVGQVLGRLGYAPLHGRVGVRARTVLVLAATAVSTAVLALVTAVWALIAAAVLAGLARGAFTLLQATAVSDRWGTAHYARLTGLLSAPLTLATAAAPWVGATVAGWLGSYAGMFLLLGGVNAIGVVLALAATPPTAGSGGLAGEAGATGSADRPAAAGASGE